MQLHELMGARMGAVVLASWTERENRVRNWKDVPFESAQTHESVVGRFELAFGSLLCSLTQHHSIEVMLHS